jgi:hypothetical protein
MLPWSYSAHIAPDATWTSDGHVRVVPVHWSVDRVLSIAERSASQASSSLIAVPFVGGWNFPSFPSLDVPDVSSVQAAGKEERRRTVSSARPFERTSSIA